MKKIITALVTTVLLGTTLTADFIRVEAGAGAWMQTPNTEMDYKSGVGLDGKDDSLGIDETEGYLWVFLKHPIPLVPNLRLEYVSAFSKGLGEGSFTFIPVDLPVNSASSIEMTQFDIIPYYNILDNTAWITLDLGIDLKVMETTYTATPNTGLVLIDDAVSYEEKISTVIPLGYVRGRFEIPATNIGVEVDIKYITYSDSEVLDFRAKLDYTLDFIPIIQPGVEIGYRVQKMYMVTDQDLTIDLDFSGIYTGVTVRF